MTTSAGGPAGCGRRPGRPAPGGPAPAHPAGRRPRRARPVQGHPIPVRAARGRPGRQLSLTPQLRLALAVFAALTTLSLLVGGVARLAHAATPPAPLAVTWSLSHASNTMTVRLAPDGGPFSRRVLARSRMTVSETGVGHLIRRSAHGSEIRIPVPPGRQTRVLVQVNGPRPFRRTLTVTLPPALRVISSRRGSAGLLVSLSGPLRRVPPPPLCGRDRVSFPAPAEVSVASSPYGCRTTLRLTARDGERARVPVTVPALPEAPLYAFASPAGQAVYITVDDGWAPSPRVLTIMRRTHLPVTAFLIQQAAGHNLPYWRAFVAAGGTVGDHTVSHPNLTGLGLDQATAQWGQARRALGRWLGQAPAMGRPPYGAFDPTVQAAAHRAGLTFLVGWSATVVGDHIQTWNGRKLEAGEIVLLHWVPGLGHQLTRLLAAIRARHLHPTALTGASFAGITPQRRSLAGD